ncbi:MAG: hypothetical protein E7559_04860 [Ruminococcaceae bacterium]|nr:hypothetical protein [Oscillospiraceae bacterium]
MPVDKERFANACRLSAERERSGIGMLSEKGIHNALKCYYEPDTTRHEVPIGGYVADIAGEDGIIEIQTATFGKMKEKLTRFLEVTNVTIVYPCVVNKRVYVLDPETGEVLYSRKSPKHCTKYSLLHELWGIRELVDNERLRICIAFLDVEEYRPKQEQRGRRRGRRGPDSRVERMPTALLDELWLCCRDDYCTFLPDTLPEQFTAKDYTAATGMRSFEGGMAVSLLCKLGMIEKVGKRGNAYLYERRI